MNHDSTIYRVLRMGLLTQTANREAVNQQAANALWYFKDEIECMRSHNRPDGGRHGRSIIAAPCVTIRTGLR